MVDKSNQPTQCTYFRVGNNATVAGHVTSIWIADSSKTFPKRRIKLKVIVVKNNPSRCGKDDCVITTVYGRIVVKNNYSKKYK